jgi:hypothetical protein
MTVRERKQLTFLIVLVIALGITLYLSPRLNRPTTVSAVSVQQAKPTQAKAANDARIRLDLIDRNTGSSEAGRENLFQYRIPQPPPAALRPPQGQLNPFATPPTPTPTPPPARPPGPPPLPPITLKYQGFARPQGAVGQLVAFLSDDRGHYNAKSGDVLMGRFRITAVTEQAVDVEDLQYNRRQTLPLLK